MLCGCHRPQDPCPGSCGSRTPLYVVRFCFCSAILPLSLACTYEQQSCPFPPHSLSSAAGGGHVVRSHSLFHSDSRGTVDGLHDGCKAAAEVIGGVGPDLRGLLQDNSLAGAVEEPGQNLTQPHLQLCCRGERRRQSVAVQE